MTKKIRLQATFSMKFNGIFNFLSRFSITKVIYSAGSVSTIGTSINSNAGPFAVSIKFPDMDRTSANRLNITTDKIHGQNIACQPTFPNDCLILSFLLLINRNVFSRARISFSAFRIFASSSSPLRCSSSLSCAAWTPRSWVTYVNDAGQSNSSNGRVV